MQQCKGRNLKLDRQLPRQQQANNMLIKQGSITQFCMFCLQTHVHADMESLYKEIPKSILPQEYGGEGGPVEVLIGEWGVFFLDIKNEVATCRHKSYSIHMLGLQFMLHILISKHKHL
jgi:hypothetical protein